MPSLDFFFTDDDRQVPAVSAAQMLEVDRVAVEGTGPNLFQMMENAGRGLAHTVIDTLGSPWRTAGILVLAGTGGNGGGGITAARHLANRGAEITLAVTNPERLAAVPRSQLDLYRAAGGREAGAEDVHDLNPALIVDALIGYSLRGPVHGTAATMIRIANRLDGPVVSLDVPSGLDATTGETAGHAVRATTTVTLALPKRGLASHLAGELLLADIGIPAAVFRRAGIGLPDPVFDFRDRIPLHR